MRKLPNAGEKEWCHFWLWDETKEFLVVAFLPALVTCPFVAAGCYALTTTGLSVALCWPIWVIATLACCLLAFRERMGLKILREYLDLPDDVKKEMQARAR